MAATFQLLAGKHTTRDEWKDGKKVKDHATFVAGDTFAVSDAEAAELRKDPERFREIK